MENNSFTQAYHKFCAKKQADAIRRRYQDKKRQLTDVKGQLEGILHMPLLNFVFHLHTEKKTVFCDWVLLNQAVTEELAE